MHALMEAKIQRGMDRQAAFNEAKAQTITELKMGIDAIKELGMEYIEDVYRASVILIKEFPWYKDLVDAATLRLQTATTMMKQCQHDKSTWCLKTDDCEKCAMNCPDFMTSKCGKIDSCKDCKEKEGNQ